MYFIERQNIVACVILAECFVALTKKQQMQNVQLFLPINYSGLG